jgi:hypothetical protein
MLILLHIIVALSGLVLAAYVFVKPSTAALHTLYGLTGATIASGTLLVATAKGHMLEACTMGLLYLGLVSLGIVSARRKLAVKEKAD